MNTLKQKNLERLIFKTFDKEIEGTDIYNHNGSMWVIFTDDKKWVVEYTKEQTLWYNYSLFNSIMMLFGMDNKETAEYVKTWFENRFLFKPKIEDTTYKRFVMVDVEDTIKNGVKHTERGGMLKAIAVEDTIQNGVKDTKLKSGNQTGKVEHTLQKGVKETCKSESTKSISLRRAIQNGVKNTNEAFYGQVYVEDTVQNGVKHCEDGDWLDGDERFEDIIQNGEKK